MAQQAWDFHKDPKEQRTRKLRALMQVYTKSNRILSGRQITCHVVPGNPVGAPAWTQRLNISFSDEMVGPVDTAEDIVRITGLNNHEYGHATLTPDVSNGSDPLAMYVRDGGPEVQQAFNVLEDQRIESMLVVLYPPMMHYLTAVFVEYIMSRREKDPNTGQPKTPDHSTTFLLSHGRRFLGNEIRDAIKAMFVMPRLADMFADVIDRYRVLDLNVPADRNVAKLLIERFIELQKKLPKDKQQEMQGYQHVTCGQDGHSTPNDKAGMAEAATAIAGVKEGDDERDNVKAAASEGDDKDEDDSDGGSGKGAGEDGDEDEGQQWGEGSGAGADSDGGRSGRGYSKGGKRNAADADHGSKALNEAVKDALNDILRDNDIARDIRNAQAALKSLDTPEHIAKTVRFNNRDEPEVVGATRRIGRKLQEIVEQHDPGWERRTPYGRLNAQRAMQGVDPEEAFDAWEEGNTEASSIEVVVAVDISGSMSGHGKDLSDAVFSIKAACDAVSMPCTVYAYASETTLIYEATDRAVPGRFPQLFTGGGTEPSTAVSEGARRLLNSKRKKRVFVIMTDGQFTGTGYWGSTDASTDDYIKAMTDTGVITAMAFFQSSDRGGRRSPVAAAAVDVTQIPSHNCGIVRHIGNLSDLVDLTSGIVRAAIKQKG